METTNRGLKLPNFETSGGWIANFKTLRLILKKGFARSSLCSVLLVFSQSYVEHDLRKKIKL
jgi:hypothetical protein